MTATSRLDTLPPELLILIFDNCSAFDLVRLSQVCKRFYEIVSADTLWIRKSKRPVVTNQVSERFRTRCNPLLCARSKWHVSHNWQYGRYKKRELLQQKAKMMPSLRMTDDVLWWCANNQLCGFKRTEELDVADNYVFNAQNVLYDFSTFVLTEDFIIAGDSYGHLRYWTYDSHQFYCSVAAHSSDINAIDATSNVVLTGSDDYTVKLRPAPVKHDVEKCSNNYSACVTMMDRVWSLAADPTGTRFAVGTSGNSHVPPLHIIDFQAYDEFDIMHHTWKHGAGILDIVWQDPHTLLTCGYDTYIRKWDLRNGKCVNAWPDPTDATLYCLSSDYQYTMITGTQFNSMAVLWDQRQKNYIQLYFMRLPENHYRSPIYSLEFDSSHLYCATDRYLVELRFSGYPEQSFNYRELNNYSK